MGNQWQSRSKTHTSIPAAPVSKSVSWRRPFPEQNTQVQPKSDDKADGQTYQRRPPSNAMSRLDSSLDLPRAMKPIQTKLTVGAPNDQYEQEADRVADQVMSMPDAATQAPVQREGMPEEEELQTKPLAAGITPLVQREELPEEDALQMKPLGTADLQRDALPEDDSLQPKSSPTPSLETQLSNTQGSGSPLPRDLSITHKCVEVLQRVDLRHQV